MSYYNPTYPTTYNPYYQTQRPMQPMIQQPVQPQPSYLCRPVASEEEARAVPTDFTGNVLVLVDQAHGRIYTKTLNMMDGTAIFTTYEVPPPPAPTPAMAPEPMPDYVTREEFQVIANELAALKGALEQ